MKSPLSSPFVLIEAIIFNDGSMTIHPTMQGRHQRCDVLAFIGEHFDVLEGVLDTESSMGITVARKRIS